MKQFFIIFSTVIILSFAMISFFPWATADAFSNDQTDSTYIAGLNQVFQFQNPIKSGNAMGLIKSVVAQIFPFVITLISLLILYIGFRMAVAAGSGNPAELTRWRKLLMYALIGAAIVAGARVLVDAISKFAQEIAIP